MADLILTLGGVTFNDFEVPEAIRAGGGQMTETHRRAGGKRTIDAFGPDDEMIRWGGTFFDDGAEARCQQIDAMRRAGAPVTVSWSSFSYLVVIKSFAWDFIRFYQIEYSIELEVIQDNAQPDTDGGTDLESDMQGDLDDVSGYESALGDSGFSAAFDQVTNLAGTVMSITGGSVPFLNELSDSLAGAQGVAETLLSQSDASLNTFGVPSLFAGGVNPSAMATNLFNVAQAAEEIPSAYYAASTLAKLSRSVNSILSGG